MTLHHVFIDMSFDAKRGKMYWSVRGLPHTTSCKKFEVFMKSNAKKRLLMDTVYLANAISNFVAWLTCREENKIVVAKEMAAAMIGATKELTNSTNNIILWIAKMKFMLHEMMTTLLATLLVREWELSIFHFQCFLWVYLYKITMWLTLNFSMWLNIKGTIWLRPFV